MQGYGVANAGVKVLAGGCQESSMNRDKPSDREECDDPWAKLSPEQRKKAQVHLRILYGVMVLMIIGPLILLLVFGRP